MQKALYPMKVKRFSATWNTSTAHKKCSSGNPHDYPTDLVGADTGRDWFYAPCDMVVLRKYTKASHAIWMRSVDKVQIPGEKEGVYLYLMSEHQDNSEMASPGHVYHQGDKCFREAANGNATGNHLHVSFGYSKELKALGNGWRKNTRKAWVLYIPGVTNIKIDAALYSGFVLNNLDNDSSTETEKFIVGRTYITTAEIIVRKAPYKTAAKVGYSGLSDYAKKHDSDKDGALNAGTSVEPILVKTAKDGSIWFKLSPGYYICANDGKKDLVKC